MEIYLIRHTSVSVEEGTIYGQSDVDLTDEFKAEAFNLKKLLPLNKESLFYSSPSSRCLLLAKALSENNPIVDSRLMELDFGEWELKKWNELERIILNKWMDDITNANPPKGESFLELFQRVSQSFLEIIHKKDKQIVIITHLGVIRSILAYILGFSLEKSFSIDIEYGSVSKLIANFDRDNEPFFKIKYLNRK